MRRAARADDNQADVTKALRSIGCSVQPIHTLGDGCPDLLVGYRGVNVLLELKDEMKPPSRQRLTEDEKRWHAKWSGQIAVVKNSEEAMQVVMTHTLKRENGGE